MKICAKSVCETIKIWALYIEQNIDFGGELGVLRDSTTVLSLLHRLQRLVYRRKATDKGFPTHIFT